MSDEANAQSIAALVIEEQDSHAVIRLNRPRERNPLSLATLDALEEAFETLTTRERITSVIITGIDDAFASGANIRELCALTPDAAAEFARRGQRLMRRIADARQLTVAAINGFCFGGGLDLALSCRVRCASPAAVFAHPGARLGIITGWGGTQRLPRLIGTARALEMFVTARRVTGAEAYEMGMVDFLEEDALECARRVASLMTGRLMTAR